MAYYRERRIRNRGASASSWQNNIAELIYDSSTDQSRTRSDGAAFRMGSKVESSSNGPKFLIRWAPALSGPNAHQTFFVYAGTATLGSHNRSLSTRMIPERTMLPLFADENEVPLCDKGSLERQMMLAITRSHTSGGTLIRSWVTILWNACWLLDYSIGRSPRQAPFRYSSQRLSLLPRPPAFHDEIQCEVNVQRVPVSVGVDARRPSVSVRQFTAILYARSGSKQGYRNTVVIVQAELQKPGFAQDRFVLDPNRDTGIKVLYGGVKRPMSCAFLQHKSEPESLSECYKCSVTSEPFATWLAATEKYEP
ncbi:hypothetical protein M404DRAFT_36495 [Pisolithus tinctorius Marx 270]|uniref:Uncharacterized protein n=1 Tax=Pisolithus tinctorius Marx 270 TaxID=870435 RepID=A0A0C3NBQ0_PISTI|nr:hypothetical protein M404DRAFT_36495 [Pisolithus tinctorius Marx 270]